MGSVIMPTQTAVNYVKTRPEAEAAAFKLLSCSHFSKLSGDGRANLGLEYKTDHTAPFFCAVMLSSWYGCRIVGVDRSHQYVAFARS
jgi:hypothetical protein